MNQLNLRSEFFLCVKRIGFRNAVALFNDVLEGHGYRELEPSDWGKFLQGSPTRAMRQAAARLVRMMPAIFPRVCHSTYVCWTSGPMCDDHECSVNQ